MNTRDSPVRFLAFLIGWLLGLAAALALLSVIPRPIVGYDRNTGTISVEFDQNKTAGDVLFESFR